MTVSPMPVLTAGLLLLSGVLAACASTTTPSVTDGQSHWLQECASDAECGPLDCVCGTCTLKCSEAVECKAALGEDVACRPAVDVEEAMCDAGAKPRICARKGGSAPGPDGGSDSPDSGGTVTVEAEVNDGDGTCAEGETPENAPLDCEETDDGLCTGDENVWSAPGDCGPVQRVSLRDDGSQLSGVEDSASIFRYGNVSVSGDGGRVAFLARNASSVDTNPNIDAYVRDLARGETILATPRMPGTQPTGGVQGVQLSDDGQWLIFGTESPDFSISDTNNKPDVYATHLDSGTTVRVSLKPDGSQYTESCGPRGTSRDSRFVRFSCGNGLTAYDLETAEYVDPTGMGFSPTMDAAGSLEAITVYHAMIPEDTNASPDVYLVSADGSTARASIRADGIEGNGGSTNPSISSDGRFVAFLSEATNLAPDPNRNHDVFVHDRVTGENLRASVRNDGDDVAGAPAGETTWFLHQGVQISANGRFVAVFSIATDFVDGDTNDAEDVFLIHIGDWVDSLPATE